MAGLTRRVLRILGLRLEVAADDLDLVQPFLDVFDAFLVDGDEGEGGVRVRIDGGRYDDGARRVDLASGRLRAAHAYNLLYTTLVRALPDVYLLHCAAVADRDRAWLIGGPSGSGKSTLVRALVARGFGFLSDDLAPLAVADGRIHPFPRRLGFVRSSLGEAGLSEEGARLMGDKAFLGAERLGARIIGAPLRPGAIVLMNPFQGPEGPIEMTAGLLADPEPLLARLRAAGMKVEVSRRVAELSILSLRLEGAPAIAAVEQELQRADRQVMFHYRGYGDEKRYADDPVLAPLPAGDAALALLREALNRERNGALMRRLGGSASAAFVELSGLLAGVPCFRLEPAAVEPTADRLAAAFREIDGE
jgi:hypothetical protein